MKRDIEDKTILDKFIESFIKVVEKHAKYAVIGGFVAISHGRSRGTEDIDLLIESMQDSKLKEFDRGIMSTETYLSDKFDTELSKIEKENDTYKDQIIPRDLPYTKSQNDTGGNA